MIPADLLYTKNHEYLRQLGDGTALVGITAYAAEALGDVVYVGLPEAGSTLAAGETFGSVESVKTVSDCFLPVDGEVLEINGDLEAHPEQVNEDPFGKGWMLKIRLVGAVSGLLDASAYEAFLGTEGH